MCYPRYGGDRFQPLFFQTLSATGKTTDLYEAVLQPRTAPYTPLHPPTPLATPCASSHKHPYALSGTRPPSACFPTSPCPSAAQPPRRGCCWPAYRGRRHAPAVRHAPPGTPRMCTSPGVRHVPGARSFVPYLRNVMDVGLRSQGRGRRGPSRVPGSVMRRHCREVRVLSLCFHTTPYLCELAPRLDDDTQLLHPREFRSHCALCGYHPTETLFSHSHRRAAGVLTRGHYCNYTSHDVISSCEHRSISRRAACTGCARRVDVVAVALCTNARGRCASLHDS